MYAMLICAALTADEIPKDVRAYFDRQEAVFEMEVGKLEELIEDLEVRSKSDPILKRRRFLTGELHESQDKLKAMEKMRLKAKPHLSLPDYVRTPVNRGDLGLLKTSKVVGVMEDRVVVKVLSPGGVGKMAVLTGLNPKDVHPVKPYNSKDLWRVIAVESDDEKLRTYLPPKQLFLASEFYVLERIKIGDMDKWRAKYDSERNLNSPEK
jgi:hypothetical protein